MSDLQFTLDCLDLLCSSPNIKKHSSMRLCFREYVIVVAFHPILVLFKGCSKRIHLGI